MGLAGHTDSTSSMPAKPGHKAKGLIEFFEGKLFGQLLSYLFPAVILPQAKKNLFFLLAVYRWATTDR